MRRLDKGKPIRAAIAAAGLDIPRLADATREVDPEGKGLSRSLIGFLVSTGRSAREECSDRAAGLLAEALDAPLERLFAIEAPLSVAAESTSTPRVQIMTSDSPPLPPQLMTSQQLAGFLQKSLSWLDKQVKSDPDFPVHYVGRSRRFDPREVLAYQARKHHARQAALAAAS